MEGDEWATTTVSDPSFFARFFLCSKGKFRLDDHDIPRPRVPRSMHLTPSFLKHAGHVRSERNSHMLRHVSKLCRTPRLHPDVIAKCIPPKYMGVHELTCGGMSRIYTARVEGTNEYVVIKTTDCSRGLGVHEYACYSMLARHGVPIPEIKYVAMYGKTLIMILSKLTLSLSSFLLACADHPAAERALFDPVIHNVQYLLALLGDESISYCDFSPDNIMVDVDLHTLEGRLVLIDPQFALSMGYLTKKIGRSWAHNVDRVHFAYKIQTLAMSEPRLRPIAARICTAFLGFVPSDEHTKTWVLNVLPDGLRIAYDCIDRAATRARWRGHGKKSRAQYGIHRKETPQPHDDKESDHRPTIAAHQTSQPGENPALQPA